LFVFLVNNTFICFNSLCTSLRDKIHNFINIDRSLMFVQENI
jgi:hypothetical protein